MEHSLQREWALGSYLWGGGKSKDTEEMGPHGPPHRGFTWALLPAAGVGRVGETPAVPV